MKYLNFLGLLTVAVYSAIALLHAVWVPGNLEVDEFGAVVLQINTLTGSICSEEDTDGGIFRACLKGGLDRLALIARHASVDEFKPVSFGKAVASEHVIEPLLGGSILREDDDPFVIPFSVWLEVLIQPINQLASLGIRQRGGLRCKVAQRLEQ